MLTRMARMARMARLLTPMARMLTRMTRWLAASHIIHTRSLSCGHDILYVSYSNIVGATYKHLKICSNPVQDKSLFFSSA